MRIWQCVLLVAVASSEVSSQEDYNVLPQKLHWVTRDQWNLFRKFFFGVQGRTSHNPVSLRQARTTLQRKLPSDAPFPCDLSNAKSASVPTSVHKLRPGDISVVGALGDSLTAGTGAVANRVLEIVENRGLSWSGGGQGTWRQYLTLPNILKEFNPKLVGYALGDYLSIERGSQFNVAEIGAETIDMPFMARELVKRIKNDPRVDLENDWKLITFQIGSNDYCGEICYQPNLKKFNEKRKADLIETFDILKENLPRTFVNFVPSPNVAYILRGMKGLPNQCWTTQRLVCPCLFGSRYKKMFRTYANLIDENQRTEMELASIPRFNTDDFTIAIQPFTVKIAVPKVRDSSGRLGTDLSLLSQDCFHFSQKGYARAASALWNNMVEPEGQKSLTWPDKELDIKCPSEERPFLFTRVNSHM